MLISKTIILAAFAVVAHAARVRYIVYYEGSGPEERPLRVSNNFPEEKIDFFVSHLRIWTNDRAYAYRFGDSLIISSLKMARNRAEAIDILEDMMTMTKRQGG